MSRVFYGWRVVGAAFVVAVLSWGTGFYGPPIFLEVVHGVRGWSLPLVSAAVTLHFLLGAAVVSRLAGLHRRFGLVRVTRAGAVLTAVGLLGWGTAWEPWQLFLAMPFSGAGWALTSGAAINAMVAPWFDRRRPAALGMAFNGASMGGVVFSPLWVLLIGGMGLGPATALVAAILMVTMWMLAGRVLSANPAAKGVQVDGGAPPGPAAATAVEARPLAGPWLDRRASTLMAATTLALFAQIGLVSQLFTVLAPVLGSEAAGWVMGLATACAIVGRTAVGRVLPAGAARRTAGAVNLLVQAAGSVFLLLADGALPGILAGCVLFGLGLGNVTSLPPLIAQAEFRRADVPRVVALVTAVSQAGYAFAPFAFALVAASGTAWLFASAAGLQVAAAATLVLMRPRPMAALPVQAAP